MLRSTPGILAAALIATGLMPAAVTAQMVDCTIRVNTEAIATSNRDLLRDFPNDLKDYVGNFNWGGGNANDKVKCTLDIFVKGVVGDNLYSAQVFIGSQRQIYNSEQSTAVVRLFDESWQFTYVKNRPIVRNTYSFNDLASFLDFYMYLIMGYDFDTYDKFSGTPLFQKAADVASLGRGSGQADWQPTTSTYSRVQLIDEILSPTYQEVRGASWKYHFCGLDSLSFNPERGYANIIQAVESIGKVKKIADPRNIIIRAFFEAKYKELADVFMNYPDPAIYLTFSAIDPNHQKAYDEARANRKQ